MTTMPWPDRLARQPGGNGPRVIELSADFICAMAGPSIFDPLRAGPTAPQANRSARPVVAKSRGGRR